MWTLGDKIREVRELKNLGIKEVAEALNIAESTYRGYENGSREPRYEMLKSIMELFEVSAEFFFGQVEYPYLPSPELYEEDISMYRLLPEPVHSLIHDVIINEYNKVKGKA